MSWDFFQNKTCEYFPCHKNIDAKDFNCMFCYCPLYALGASCGGNFKFSENGTKDCSECVLPHIKGFSEIVNENFNKIDKLIKKDLEK